MNNLELLLAIERAKVAKFQHLEAALIQIYKKLNQKKRHEHTNSNSRPHRNNHIGST